MKRTKKEFSIVAAGVAMLFLLSCIQTASHRQANQPADSPPADVCDDPDAAVICCFAAMPSALTNRMTITQASETGDPLVLSGTVFKADGSTPAPDVIIYAYHTDSKGYYSKKGTETGFQKWHGRLHGWCRTDANGRYEIRTIRPARYPDQSMPAHIHAAIRTSTGRMFWINDYVFHDDSLVNKKYLSSLSGVGGTGVVTLTRTAVAGWSGKRDMVLSPE